MEGQFGVAPVGGDDPETFLPPEGHALVEFVCFGRGAPLLLAVFDDDGGVLAGRGLAVEVGLDAAEVLTVEHHVLLASLLEAWTLWVGVEPLRFLLETVFLDQRRWPCQSERSLTCCFNFHFPLLLHPLRFFFPSLSSLNRRPWFRRRRRGWLFDNNLQLLWLKNALVHDVVGGVVVIDRTAFH